MDIVKSTIRQIEDRNQESLKLLEVRPDKKPPRFNKLSRTAAKAAMRMFDKIGVVSGGGLPPIRSALLDVGVRGKDDEVTGCFVPDPLQASQKPSTWRYFKGGTPTPEYHGWRTQQVLWNVPWMQFTKERDCHAGKPAYIVGNGPSAPLAAEVLPKRDERDGLVFCINGSQAMFPDDMDYWVAKDALWPDGHDDWYEKIRTEWASVDATGCEGIFSLYSNHGVMVDFTNRGGNPNFVQGHNRNPYRDLVPLPLQEKLPSFIEGLQSIVGAMHAAQWMGCNPIVLFGIDECRDIGSTQDHAVGMNGRPPRPEWNVQFWETEGINRRVETCAPWVQALHHIAAMSMWLADGGVTTWNCRDGLDLVFAPHIPAEPLVEVLEHDGDPMHLMDLAIGPDHWESNPDVILEDRLINFEEMALDIPED